MLLKSVQNSWHSLVNTLQSVSTVFVSSLAKSIEENGGQVLRDAAMAAVNAAENGGGTGKEKFDYAWKTILKTLRKNGIPVVENAVRGAIESAVAEMNSGK